MYSIGIQKTFSGAHRLRHYRGKCERLHGHNWEVHIVLAGETLGRDGLLIDFKIAMKELDRIVGKLDHQYLNTLTRFTKKEPTAENIAAYIFHTLKDSLQSRTVRIRSARVYESLDCWAEYSE